MTTMLEAPPIVELPPFAAVVDQELGPSDDIPLDRDVQESAWNRIGRQLIGLLLVDHRRDDPSFGSFTWERGGVAQPQGLPRNLVAEAQAAFANEDAARLALMDAARQAEQYGKKHKLSWDALRVHMELHCAEKSTAWRDAAERTTQACTALGRAAAAIAQARRTLASVPGKRAAIEERYQQQLAELSGAEAAARAVVSSYGLGDA